MAYCNICSALSIINRFQRDDAELVSVLGARARLYATNADNSPGSSYNFAEKTTTVDILFTFNVNPKSTFFVRAWRFGIS